MNCQDFESNIDGLARGALMDARAREVALAHESACTRCAARLADERVITSGLRVLAADTRDRKAPARVEAALLAAFRARAASSVAVAATATSSEGAHDVATATGGSVVPLADETLSRPWSWMRTIAVASLAAAAALALFMLIPPTVPKTTESSLAGNQTSGQKKAGPPTGPVETATRRVEQVSMPDNVIAPITSRPADVEKELLRATAPPRRSSNRAVQTTPASFSTSDARSSQAQPDQTASNSEEITTDFISLIQGERLTQGEVGHLVRVELPRSALERFGLPVNAERAGGRVKADVLLGEDGLARAIRFVR